ncbi:MAG: hypothetical protein HRT89_22000, partial [Lentisphaeria bacterium]|nr:hypothetical protein [Lentisphaeria bacterium]NQZ70736.1 hypothetical protein [Lentisphaeria bacterium]
AFIIRKQNYWPQMPALQILCVSLIPIGLLGMHQAELKIAVKELVQVAEIFIITWFVFASAHKHAIKKLCHYLGYLALGIALGIVSLKINHIYELAPFELSEARYMALLIISSPFIIQSFRHQRYISYCIFTSIAILVGLSIESGQLVICWSVTMLLSGFLLKYRAAYAVAILAASFALLSPFTDFGQSFSSQYSKKYMKRIAIENRAALKGPGYYPLGAGLGEYKRAVNNLKQYQDLTPSPDEFKIPRDSNNQYLLTLLESSFLAAIAYALMLIGLVYLALRKRQEEMIYLMPAVLALISIALLSLYCNILGRGTGIWVGAMLGLVSHYLISPRDSPKRFFIRLAIPTACCLIFLSLMMTQNTHEDKIEHISNLNARLNGEKKVVVPDKPNGGRKIEVFDPWATGNTQTVEQIKIEGESYASISGSFTRLKSNNSSGNMVLSIPQKSGKAMGQANYIITVKEAGNYDLSARVFWADGCSNSLGFDYNDSQYRISSELFNKWHILHSKKMLTLKKGENTIAIKNIEDGVLIDYFILKKSE